MAYNAVVTVEMVGTNMWEVTVEETDAGPTSSTPVDGLPVTGTVVEVAFEHLAGTGTKANPRLTRTTPPTSAEVSDIVVQPLSAAAASGSNRGSAIMRLFDQAPAPAKGGRAYHCAQVDAGTDNTVKTVYYVYGNTW